ncbi:TPA: Rz1 family lipoprotein, partial [Escherichia coli]|nr:Rz1 family lipoprotein [Escherichia coli]
KLCVLMLPLVVSACGSTPPATVPCVKPPAPPAWIMQPAPDWQTPLNGIISSSENG